MAYVFKNVLFKPPLPLPKDRQNVSIPPQVLNYIRGHTLSLNDIQPYAAKFFNTGHLSEQDIEEIKMMSTYSD